MSNSIRFVSVLGLVAVAAASQAVMVSLSSHVDSGFPTVPFATNYNEPLQTNNSQSPFSNIAINSNVVLNFNGGANSTATYTSTGPTTGAGATGGSVTFSFNSAQTSTGTGVVGFLSGGTVTAATGVYAPYLGNIGALVTSNTNTVGGSNDFTITGNLTPATNVTPEPASLAALGVGAVALLRRRRKA